jgi:hypothetical protein
MGPLQRLQERLKSKRCLLIVDDADYINAFQAGGALSWVPTFLGQSKCLVTTRATAHPFREHVHLKLTGADNDAAMMTALAARFAMRGVLGPLPVQPPAIAHVS